MSLLSQEALDELEALEFIFPPGDVRRGKGGQVCLRVAPEPDELGHRCASAILMLDLSHGYPSSEAAKVVVTLEDAAQPPVPPEVLASLQMAAEGVAHDLLGSAALFSIAEAVRDWLREHAQLPDLPPHEAPEAPAEPTDDSEDDLDVDSSDLDEELIEALQDVLDGDEPKLKQLKRLSRLGPGAEQRGGLRAMLKELTPQQREHLIGTSSEEENSPSAKTAPKAKAVASPSLPKARIECDLAHQLTAYAARPPDYRGFDGDEYTCDVCHRDGFYRSGVYHCSRCFQQGGRQFDACPSCATLPTRGSSGGGKKTKGKGQRR